MRPVAAKQQSSPRRSTESAGRASRKDLFPDEETNMGGEQPEALLPLPPLNMAVQM